MDSRTAAEPAPVQLESPAGVAQRRGWVEGGVVGLVVGVLLGVLIGREINRPASQQAVGVPNGTTENRNYGTNEQGATAATTPPAAPTAPSSATGVPPTAPTAPSSPTGTPPPTSPRL